MNSAKADIRDYEVVEFNKNQTAKLIDIKKRRLEKEKAKQAAKHTFKNVMGTVLLVILMVAMFSMIVYRNSQVNEAKYEIFNLKTEIKSLNTNIEELKASLESCTDIKTVEEIAINDLNMRYPTKEQYVYIDATYEYALSKPALTASEEILPPVEESEESKVQDFVSAIFNTKR